jgi:histidine triad (HIT) family protein
MSDRTDCIFCRIADGDVPANVVAEGRDWLAFRDLDPQAPTHVLVIPRRHIGSVDALGPDDEGLGDALLEGCREVSRACGLDSGYRVVTNVGDEGGQDVPHLHLHVLGGRQMRWPPG